MRLLFALIVSFVCAVSAPPCRAGAGVAVSEISQLGGVDYRIDIPANWNHGLVVYFHGYAVDPVTFRKDDALSPMFAPILASGFAVIQSAYSATGWAVE